MREAIIWKSRTAAVSWYINRNFAALWAAQAISAMGDRITRTAIPMLAILTIDAAPYQIAILSAVSFAPGLLVSLFLGAWIDRSAKRPILIGSDLARAALLLTVPLAAHLGLMSMAQLYIVAGLVGAFSTLFGIVDNTFLPAVVGRDTLVEANARLEATEAVAEGAGPWLGGVLVATIGAPLALVLDALSYLWSAVVLRRVNVTDVGAAEAADSRAIEGAGEGFRLAWQDQIVRRLLIAEALFGLGGGVFFALYMVVTLDSLGLGPGIVGFIIGVGGAGAALGAAVAPYLSRRLGVGLALFVAFALGKLFDVLVPLSLVFPDIAVILLITAQLLGDGFIVIFLVLAMSLRQQRIPDSVLGRVNATFHFCEGGALVIGALTAGALTLFLPVSVVIWGSVVLSAAAIPVLWGLRSFETPAKSGSG